MTVATSQEQSGRLRRARRWRRIGRPRRRHRHDPRQGPGHRRLRPRVAGGHRADHDRRADRRGQRRHLPAVRRGHQPPRPVREGRGQGPRRARPRGCTEGGAKGKTTGVLDARGRPSRTLIAASRRADEQHRWRPRERSVTSRRRSPAAVPPGSVPERPPATCTGSCPPARSVARRSDRAGPAAKVSPSSTATWPRRQRAAPGRAPARHARGPARPRGRRATLAAETTVLPMRFGAWSTTPGPSSRRCWCRTTTGSPRARRSRGTREYTRRGPLRGGAVLREVLAEDAGVRRCSERSASCRRTRRTTTGSGWAS